MLLSAVVIALGATFGTSREPPLSIQHCLSSDWVSVNSVLAALVPPFSIRLAAVAVAFAVVKVVWIFCGANGELWRPVFLWWRGCVEIFLYRSTS